MPPETGVLAWLASHPPVCHAEVSVTLSAAAHPVLRQALGSPELPLWSPAPLTQGHLFPKAVRPVSEQKGWGQGHTLQEHHWHLAPELMLPHQASSSACRPGVTPGHAQHWGKRGTA